MQLFILNPGSSVGTSPGPYQGGKLVNDYSSMIWTDRFRDYGEFQLNIPRDAASANTFFPGLLLGIQNSQRVMLAETQRELVNEQGYREVIVTGRSAESIIEDRVLWAPKSGTSILPKRYTYLDAVLLYLWQAVLNNTTSDVAYTVSRPNAISTNSKISDALVTDSSQSGGATRRIGVTLGQIGPQIRGGLNLINHGLRCLRPPTDVSWADSITVDPVNGPNKGTITRTPLSGTTDKLRFDVYKGVDRSKMPASSGKYIFLSDDAGHLDNVNVSTTYREFITGAVHSIDDTHYYGSSSPLSVKKDFGIRHRYVDASQLVTGMDAADYPEVIADAQQEYYQTHTNRAILEADLTTNTPFVYGTDYLLGDTVMLTYKGRTRRSLVNEYTRVDDAEGYREYPGFLAWDEITEGAVVRDW